MATITVELLDRRNICEPVTSVFLKINNDPFDQGFRMEDDLVSFFKGLGKMFYLVNPEETIYASPELVPKFYRQVRVLSFIVSNLIFPCIYNTNNFFKNVNLNILLIT